MKEKQDTSSIQKHKHLPKYNPTKGNHHWIIWKFCP